eukprot:scaffold35521_cov112-Isochrysis_galbana.AAC.1
MAVSSPLPLWPFHLWLDSHAPEDRLGVCEAPVVERAFDDSRRVVPVACGACNLLPKGRLVPRLGLVLHAVGQDGHQAERGVGGGRVPQTRVPSRDSHRRTEATDWTEAGVVQLLHPAVGRAVVPPVGRALDVGVAP